MSNRSGFGSGFWLGTLVGGVVGGVIGATIATRQANRDEGELGVNGLLGGERGEKRPLKSSRLRTADRMERARRSLDDKISDLNNAIDVVRSSIGTPLEDSLASHNDELITEQKPAEAEG